MHVQSNLQGVLTAPLFDDKPFTLCIGPQRTGTSWLDRYMRFRGDVCLPTGVKEVFFFDRHYAKGADFYTAKFRPKPNHKIVMEAATTAFDHAHAPSRVFELCGPAVTLLCPLRHPVTRSYSLYRHFRRYGLVSGSLRQAVASIPQILTTSHYAEHLTRWGDHFGLENINFVFQEDLEADPDAFLRRLCRILHLDYIAPCRDTARPVNVSTHPRPPFIAGPAQSAAEWARDRELHSVINIAKQLGLKHLLFGREDLPGLNIPIPADDLEWLSERLLPEIEKLETLLNAPIPQWRKG